MCSFVLLPFLWGIFALSVTVTRAIQCVCVTMKVPQLPFAKVFSLLFSFSIIFAWVICPSAHVRSIYSQFSLSLSSFLCVSFQQMSLIRPILGCAQWERALVPLVGAPHSFCKLPLSVSGQTLLISMKLMFKQLLLSQSLQHISQLTVKNARVSAKQRCYQFQKFESGNQISILLRDVLPFWCIFTSLFSSDDRWQAWQFNVNQVDTL